MVKSRGAARSVRHRLAWKLLTGAAIIVLAAGCTRTGKKHAPGKQLAAFDYSKQGRRPALKPNHPLHIAATQWAREHQKKPANPVAALNYARTLKALGSKDKALEVLARTYQLNQGNNKLASEYGRLALDLGKVQMAEQLLNQAQRARGQTDWRVLSALGTVNAKRGKHKKAQSYYLAALRQKPDATSVFNNLALSYALDGRVGDAEDLLKRAVAKGHNTRRVRQNLALVLGLQSKFGEAQKIAQADLNGDKVDNNVNFMREMVKPIKVASAKSATAKTKRKARAKADTITTAALPKKKHKSVAASNSTANAPLPRRKPSAPVKTDAASAPAKAVRKALKKTQPVSGTSRRVAAKTTQPAKQVPVTSKSAKKIKVASARMTVPSKSASKVKTRKSASVLPWAKKPAAIPRPARTAKLGANSSGAPTSILPKSDTSWSVVVTPGATPAPNAGGTAAPKALDTFEFPSTE